MPAWSRSRIVFRSPMAGLSLIVALVMIFAIACGGEDDPTATTAPAPAAAPTHTSAPDPTATDAPAATPTTAAAPAATATTRSVAPDYGADYGESPTKAPMDEPTEEPSDDPSATDEVAVPIQGFRFLPAEVTVTVGTTITWTNMDSAPHSATADDGSWDTGVLGQGESGSVTFDTPGTYTYYCAVHPNMTATVIVTSE